jgi:hypothetical protein
LNGEEGREGGIGRGWMGRAAKQVARCMSPGHARWVLQTTALHAGAASNTAGCLCLK